jgi:hypothetical protein
MGTLAGSILRNKSLTDIRKLISFLVSGDGLVLITLALSPVYSAVNKY